MPSAGNSSSKLNKSIPNLQNKVSNEVETILEHWRESYGWWNDEPYREIKKVLTTNGVIVLQEKETVPLGAMKRHTQLSCKDNNRE